MRISDWSSDVCSSDLITVVTAGSPADCGWPGAYRRQSGVAENRQWPILAGRQMGQHLFGGFRQEPRDPGHVDQALGDRQLYSVRSEEHTSELQSLMRISYAVFCLKKKKVYKNTIN